MFKATILIMGIIIADGVYAANDETSTEVNYTVVTCLDCQNIEQFSSAASNSLGNVVVLNPYTAIAHSFYVENKNTEKIVINVDNFDGVNEQLEYLKLLRDDIKLLKEAADVMNTQ